MPGWIQAAIGAAALLVAVGTIWSKALRPAARLITTLEETAPLLNDLPILREIIAQVRTNAGSSLRDAIDRIEARGIATDLAVTALTTQLAAVTTQGAVQAALIERIDRKVSLGVVSVTRAEATAVRVADELLATQHRADEAHGPPGAAADAGLRSPSQEEDP